MLATIKVIRKKPTTSGTRVTYDQATGSYSADAFETIIESVKARIQPYGIIGDIIDGQDTTGRRLMRVQIEDVQTSIHLDDMIVVLDSPDNPELTAYTIEVRGAISSSNAWLTDLVCEADLKANT
jgi:hypothetical protein